MKPTLAPITTFPRRWALALALPCLSLGPALRAADVFWNPDIDGDVSWNNGTNWTGGNAPANDLSTDIAVFNQSTYNFQPTLDAFTVQSVNGFRFGGAALTLDSSGTANQLTSGIAPINSTTLTLADVTGLVVGQTLSGSDRIRPGTFITAIDTETNTITLSAPTRNGNLASGTSLAFQSSFKIGAGGITVDADTTGIQQINAPLVLGANQVWTSNATGDGRALSVQGSIYLDNHTLTLSGIAGSVININGGAATQGISGSGSLVIDTDGLVNIGSGSGNRPQHTFTGGVTLEKGTLQLNGGNSGGGDAGGNLGTGVLTINGGRIQGAGNIAGHALTISGQVWNADWEFGGNRAVHMGTGEISLGETPGTTRTLTVSASLPLTLGGAIVDGVTANSFNKDGSGEVILAGINTYTGDTTVSLGTMTLGSTGALTFYIGADGENNRVGGTGTFNVSGTFILDLSGAEAVAGNSWSLVAVDTLTESFTSSFLLKTSEGDVFVETGLDSGVWEWEGYSFSEATGILSYGTVIPEPAAFALLGGAGMLFAAILRRRRTRPARAS